MTHLTNPLIIDTETTGLDPENDRLVEIAGLKLDSDKYFTSLCNPGRDIPPQAMAIHHITEEDARPHYAPAVNLQRMLDELGYPSLMIFHNAKFDTAFLRKIWTRKPSQPSVPILCTYKCAYHAWPEAPSYSNQVLRYWLGLKPPVNLLSGLAPHRALYDIVVTREIFKTLINFYEMDQLLDWSARPLLLRNVAFGTHKGKAWSAVPHGYLRWCRDNILDNEDVQYTVNHYLNKGE